MSKSTIGTRKNEAGPLEQRLRMAVTYNNIGRPGENKFVDMRNWEWHAPHELFSMLWQEVKTGTIQAMPMVPDMISFYTDIYHALGSAWSVEDLLLRSPDQSSCYTFLFPTLHAVRENTVSIQLKESIRKNLPPNCPQDVINMIVGKSIRQACITDCLLNKNLTFVDVCGRSGHATGTTLESYEDKNNISTGLRAAKALAHHDNVDAHVSVPKIDRLPSHETGKLFTHLFAISDCLKSKFDKESGSLYPILETCMASLIMWHNTLIKELGHENAVVTKLNAAAREAKIADQRFGNVAPELILLKWSDIVMEGFKTSNKSIDQVGADGSGLAVAINQQSEMFNLLLAKLDSVQAKLGEVEQTVATQSQTISYLHDKVDTLQRDKDELTTQIALSPSGGGKKRSKKRSLGGSSTSNKKQATGQPSLGQPTASSSAQASTQSLPSTAVAQAASSSAQASTTAQASKPKQQHLVVLRNNSESKKKGKPSDKNKYLSIVLSECCKLGTLAYGRPWAYDYSTNDWSEVQSLKNVLELAWLVASNEEKNVLKDKTTDKAKLNDVTCDIEERAFRKMYELEGRNPDTEMKNNEKNPSRAAKPTYLALGARVRNYKKQLGQLYGQPKAKDITLVERPTRLTAFLEAEEEKKKKKEQIQWIKAGSTDLFSVCLVGETIQCLIRFKRQEKLKV